jgi:hypothetical protein
MRCSPVHVWRCMSCGQLCKPEWWLAQEQETGKSAPGHAHNTFPPPLHHLPLVCPSLGSSSEVPLLYSHTVTHNWKMRAQQYGSFCGTSLR